jgi:hypothetical protein
MHIHMHTHRCMHVCLGLHKCTEQELPTSLLLALVRFDLF